MQNTGKLLDLLLRITKINRKEFAEELGVTPAAVTQWIRDSSIKTSNLVQIATYFHITMKELIEGKINDDTFLFYKDYIDISLIKVDGLDWQIEAKDKILDFLSSYSILKEIYEYLLDDYRSGKLDKNKMMQFDYLKETTRYPHNFDLENVKTMSDQEYDFFKETYFPIFAGISYHDIIELNDIDIAEKFFNVACQSVLDDALIFAIEEGKTKIIQILLKIGAKMKKSHLNKELPPQYIDSTFLSMCEFVEKVEETGETSFQRTFAKNKEAYSDQIDTPATLKLKAQHLNEFSPYFQFICEASKN